MKRSIVLLFAGLVVIVLCIGCAGLKLPTLAKTGPLAKIVCFKGEVPAGESGPTAVGIDLNPGGIIVLTAQGRDAQGNYVPVEPTWTPTKPGIVEITPSTGSKVTLKGIKEGTIDINVEFAGVKHLVEIVAVR